MTTGLRKKPLKEQRLQLQMVWPPQIPDLDIMEYEITWRDRRKRKQKYCGKFAKMLGSYLPSTLAKAEPGRIDAILKAKFYVTRFTLRVTLHRVV